jgi:hypothetical protein
MDDGLNRFFAQRALEFRAVDQFRHDQTFLRNCLPMPRGQVIVHADVVSGFQQQRHRVTSDVAGAARDENSHACVRLGGQSVERK